MFKKSASFDEWESIEIEELWEAFCDDNRDALSTLFLRVYERLFRYGMHFSSSEEVVKDGIQKLFFRLWRKRKVLSCPQSVDAYLYVSLRRILLRSDERRKARNERNVAYVEEEYSEIFSIEELIILREDRKQRKALFQKALQALTLRQKEALLLRVDSGMSNQEIADIMGVSDKRVRNLIYEATKCLKEEIHKLVALIEE